ncbi:MAG: hypothetical protein IPN95_27160 [Bacteroidetes bacterium]|nr:hypothetical protein [Bacteroidota bacterium]MBL0020168.1 hypothetical protein [Bacteroidota bacterium]
MPAEVEIPNIPLRRHPLFGFVLLFAGLAAVVVGLLLSDFWVVFMGVLPVIFAALMMLSPFVVVTNEVVELRNVFGLVRASYAHDGFHVIGQENGLLWIQRGDMRAAVKRVSEKRLHKGDWHVLRETVTAAKAIRAEKSKSQHPH